MLPEEAAQVVAWASTSCLVPGKWMQIAIADLAQRPGGHGHAAGRACHATLPRCTLGYRGVGRITTAGSTGRLDGLLHANRLVHRWHEPVLHRAKNRGPRRGSGPRSEAHTSELHSREKLVCR